MSRAKWKGPYMDRTLLRKTFQDPIITKKLKKDIKIWFRSSVIPEIFIGKHIYVHNGKVFKNVAITKDKVGYKFGDFSRTRTYTYRKVTKKQGKKGKK